MMKVAANLRRRITGAAVLAAILAAILALVLGRRLVVCGAVLRELPEPDGWRAWPLLPGLESYSVGGRPVMVKYGLGLEETELRAPGLCPRGGVSLDRWFVDNPAPGPAYSRHEGELRLHASGEITVVSGIAPGPAQPEAFIVAFQRISGTRVVFRTALSERLAALSGLGLLVLAITGAFAWRGVFQARSFHDPECFRAGVRDASGAITFEDGAAPLHASPARAGRPGPVLVHVLGAREGSYRDAPSTEAVRVIEGDASTLATRALERGAGALRAGFWCAMMLLITGALATACAAADAAMRTLY